MVVRCESNVSKNPSRKQSVGFRFPPRPPEQKNKGRVECNFLAPPNKKTETQRPPGRPCCPEGLPWKKEKMSLCTDSGYFPLAWCRTFCMLSASMQIPPGRSCKKMQTTLSLTLSPPPHAFSPPSPRWLYGCSLFDVPPPPLPHRLLSPVLLFLLPSFLSPLLSLLSLSAVFCPASLHAWPALLWLLTSKSYFIHQSLIRERGPFSAALKEREGTRSECIK